LPVIIISVINSIVSVGLQPYLNQGTISMMTCLLALACSIIGSIELYLAIQKSMENELMASKDFYILSIDLNKTLTFTIQHRPTPAKEYLEKKYSEYVKLFENSNLLPKKITDSLNPLSITSLYLNKKPGNNFLHSTSSSDEDYDLSPTPLSNSVVNSIIDEEAMVSLIPQKTLLNDNKALMTFLPQQLSQDGNQKLLTTLTQNLSIPNKSSLLSSVTQNLPIHNKDSLLSKIPEKIIIPDTKELVSSISKNISIPDEETILSKIQESIPVELLQNVKNNIEIICDEETITTNNQDSYEEDNEEKKPLSP
jgi:hypothetical protein